MNLIETGRFMDIVEPSIVTSLYTSLDNIMRLQYGKVLLATSPRNRLEREVERGLPYFSSLSQQVSRCLNGNKCREALDEVHSLGKSSD